MRVERVEWRHMGRLTRQKIARCHGRGFDDKLLLDFDYRTGELVIKPWPPDVRAVHVERIKGGHYEIYYAFPV